MGPGVPSWPGCAGSGQSWQPPARAACLHTPASSFPSLCAGAGGLCPPLGMLGAGGMLPVPLPVLLPVLPVRHLPGNPLLSGCCFIFSAEKIELKAIAPPPPNPQPMPGRGAGIKPQRQSGLYCGADLLSEGRMHPTHHPHGAGGGERGQEPGCTSNSLFPPPPILLCKANLGIFSSKNKQLGKSRIRAMYG